MVPLYKNNTVKYFMYFMELESLKPYHKYTVRFLFKGIQKCT